MPSIEQNRKKWGRPDEWSLAGNQWSESWGGPEKQWCEFIYPRIRSFLPTESILEIAPGFGRWTEFLLQQCKEFRGVDLNPNCVEACRERFPGVTFFQNDGKSLAMIPSASVNFAFSFDSLVHVEADVMDAYISQLPRILKPGGVAFLHHSNYGAHLASPLAMWLTRVPVIRRGVIGRFGVKPNPHWRAESVSAEKVREIVNHYGLRCVSQELVHWSADYTNDCFTTISA